VAGGGRRWQEVTESNRRCKGITVDQQKTGEQQERTDTVGDWWQVVAESTDKQASTPTS